MRHPDKAALGAWFDGEGHDELTNHIARCARCRGHVAELRRVRAAVRGETTVPSAVVTRRVPAAALMLPAVAAALVVALMPSRGDDATRVAGIAGRPPARESVTAVAGADFFPPTTAAPASGGANRPAATTATAPASGAPPAELAQTAAGESPVGLRLGLAVPRSGPLVAEADDTVRAVTQVVNGANARGGAGGRPVELVVVDSLDAGAVAGLATKVDALVGGFGSAVVPTNVPWLMPADPHLTGSLVVPAEPPASEVGAVLGKGILERRRNAKVGVVASNRRADDRFIDGLESVGIEVVTLRSEGPEGSEDCMADLRSLRRAGVTGLALTGGSGLVLECLDALFRLRWRPPGGVVAPPTALYGGPDQPTPVEGARTLMGLPGPTWEEPGPIRFRAAVPKVTSYRALVSFSAAEVAIALARAGLPVSGDGLADMAWKNDLITLDDGVNTGARLVEFDEGTWIPEQ